MSEKTSKAARLGIATPPFYSSFCGQLGSYASSRKVPQKGSMEKTKRTAGFHESFERDEDVQGSSNRGFGLTVGGILLAIGAYRWYAHGLGDWLFFCLTGIGAPLVLLALLKPSSLTPLNVAWTRLGLLLFRVVNPVVMFLLFALAILPIGLIMRAFGKDFLRLKRDGTATSYWILRQPPGPPAESMTDQF